MSDLRPDPTDTVLPDDSLVIQALDALGDAVDDLWACIGINEIAHLQPETVALAKSRHDKQHHNAT